MRSLKDTDMHFPMFVDLTDKLVIVIGGGRIATRRIKTLLQFGCRIRVIAPQLSCELQELVNNGLIEYVCSIYMSGDLQDAFIAIAATNDRAVNHEIYLAATAQSIHINIIDKKEECSFFFPAVFESAEICGGLVSKGGQAHSLVKQTAADIRELLNGGK